MVLEDPLRLKTWGLTAIGSGAPCADAAQSRLLPTVGGRRTVCPQRCGASRGQLSRRGRPCWDVSNFVVGAGALAGPVADVIRPHEKRGNAPTQKIPNSSFLILKKLPRRQLRHPGAAGPAQADFRPPGQAVTAGAKGGRPRDFGRRPQTPRARCCPPHWGSSGGRGLWAAAAAKRRRGTHRARTPLSASLPTFSARRK